MTEQTMARLVAKYAAATTVKLIEQSAVINAIADDLSDEDYRDRHAALLEAEQDRRCVADVATAHGLAGQQLYPTDRLTGMFDADLQRVRDFADADAHEKSDVVYDGMTRAETIATARRTVADVDAEIARRERASEGRHL